MTRVVTNGRVAVDCLSWLQLLMRASLTLLIINECTFIFET